MRRLVIAKDENINDIVALRVEMQIEDWNRTLGKDFSGYSAAFYEMTKRHIQSHLNQSLYFALMYLGEKPVAMCAVEELCELPQITMCAEKSGRHGCVVSVYTRPQYRERGYQQELLKYLLAYAGKERFHDITLTTNTPDAAHIYEKIGFQKISSKYFLKNEIGIGRTADE